MSKEIPLGRSDEKAIVDDEDYERVIARGSWRVHKNRHARYARTTALIGGKQKHTALHRFILDAKAGGIVDHLNGDGLDNRKDNLRLCSIGENSRNRRVSLNKKYTKYKGAFYDITRCNYSVSIKVNNNQIYIGRFKTEEEAALAYDEAARKYHGAFATLNFPKAGERSCRNGAK